MMVTSRCTRQTRVALARVGSWTLRVILIGQVPMAPWYQPWGMPECRPYCLALSCIGAPGHGSRCMNMSGMSSRVLTLLGKVQLPDSGLGGTTRLSMLLVHNGQPLVGMGRGEVDWRRTASGATLLARKPAELTDLRDGMTGIRFEQRVSFPLLALLATKSGALVLSAQRGWPTTRSRRWRAVAWTGQGGKFRRNAR
jgi:hypothetical protein